MFNTGSFKVEKWKTEGIREELRKIESRWAQDWREYAWDGYYLNLEAFLREELRRRES
jgi:hypothetical protein